MLKKITIRNAREIVWAFIMSDFYP
jgi:hypothetical protein